MLNIIFAIGVIAFLIGVLMLFLPGVAKKLSNLLNTVVFTDSKLFMARGAGGSSFILLGVFLIVISEFGASIWGEFLWGGDILKTALLFAGIISFAFGILFLIKPLYLIRISDWGNRVIFSDDKLQMHPRILGFFLSAAGIYIMYRIYSIMN